MTSLPGHTPCPTPYLPPSASVTRAKTLMTSPLQPHQDQRDLTLTPTPQQAPHEQGHGLALAGWELLPRVRDSALLETLPAGGRGLTLCSPATLGT